MKSTDYRALIKLNPGSGDTPLLHLIREDSETSLCGIPRTQLRSAESSEDVVCPECIDWLPRRRDFSQRHPRVRKTET
jgi:hypothetical protein